SRSARPSAGQRGRGRAGAADGSGQSLPPDETARSVVKQSRLAGAALWFGLLASPLLAPDTTVVEIRPTKAANDTTPGAAADVIQRVIAIYNDPGTTRLSGSFTLPVGARLVARVAIFRGTLRVNGTLQGPVTVINGDLIIGTSGTVDGDVVVVGGRIDQRPGGIHLGWEETYDGLAPVFRQPSGLLAIRSRGPQLGNLASASKSFQTGRVTTTLSLGTGRTYNRVEGLPILFGPTFTSIGPSG